MESLTPAMNSRKILIIGGSSTGLMHGIVLKRLGHNVHILEQNTQSERADLAAGITTHPSFEEFMARHDRTGKPWSVHSPGVRFLNKDASVKKAINKPLQMTSWGVIYHRLRVNFDGYTSDFCPDAPEPDHNDGNAKFEGGRRVTSISLASKDLDSAVEVTYEDVNNHSAEGKVLADMVILADGASSNLRKTLFPLVERTYAGYVAFRGTVPEADVSEEAKKKFDPNLTYYTFKNGYILLYIIPGANGSLLPGHRRYNWVWYHTLQSSSPAFTSIMTDTAGILHRNTLPVGGIQESEWALYVSLAQKVMCTPFAEMVRKTTQPFITAISDLSCPRALALDEKCLIAGETLNLMRPHMALSTTASATQALLLERAFKGEISLLDWERDVIHNGQVSMLKTNAFGTFLLYGWFEAAGWGLKLARTIVGGIFSRRSNVSSGLNDPSEDAGTIVGGIFSRRSNVSPGLNDPSEDAGSNKSG